MSSLQKQLLSLKTTEDQNARNFNTSEKPSILFSFKEAATISHSKIYEMALEGFLSLVQIIPELHSFRNFLFENSQYSNLDRNKLTANDNEQVHQTVQKIVLLISQDFTNLNALKIIEYLLRNFQIHQFESNLLIYALIHYHSTALYTKLLQNINLDNQYKWYNNLEQTVISGKGFDRQYLVGRILKSHPLVLEEFAGFLIEYSKLKTLKKAIGTTTGSTDFFISKNSSSMTRENDNSGYRFYCVLVAEALKAHPENENIKRVIKTNFWKFLSAVIDDKHYEFLSGLVFMSTHFALSGLLTIKDLKILILDLMTNCFAQISWIQTEIIKLLLLFCSFGDFKLTSKIMQVLPVNFIQSFEQVSKNYSNYYFVVKIVEFIGRSLEKSRTPSENEMTIFSNSLEILIKFDQKFNESPQFKTFLFNRLVVVFQAILKADDFNHFHGHVLTLKKSLSLFEFDSPEIIRMIFQIEGMNIESFKKFKNNFRKTFGDLLLFGIVDESEFSLDNINFNKNRKTTALWLDLRTCSNTQKSILLNKIRTDISSKKRVLRLSEKQQYIFLFDGLLNDETNFENAIDIIKVLEQITGEYSQNVSQARKKVIQKILIKKASDFESNEQGRAFSEFLSMSDNNIYNNVFCRMFILLLDSKLNSEKLDQVFINHFFEISYEDFLSFVEFFVTSKKCADALPKLVLQLVETILSSIEFGEQVSIKKIERCSKFLKFLTHSYIEKYRKNDVLTCFQKILFAVFENVSCQKNISKFIFDISIELFSDLQKLEANQFVFRAINNTFKALSFLGYFMTISVENVTLQQLKIVESVIKTLWQNAIPKGYYELMIGFLIKLLSILTFEKKELRAKAQVLVKIITFMSRNYNQFYVKKLNKKNLRGVFFKSISNILSTNEELIVGGDIGGFLKKIKLLFTHEVNKLNKNQQNAIEVEMDEKQQNLTQVEKIFVSFLNGIEFFYLKEIVLEEYLVSILSLLKETQFDFALKYITYIQNKYWTEKVNPLFASNLALFHLKNNNYDRFMEIVFLFCRSNSSKSNEFYMELKRDLTLAQDYIKIICLFEFWRNDNGFTIAQTKLNISEFLTLISVIFNTSIRDNSTSLGNENELVANFAFCVSKMTKSPQNLSNLFALLGICCQFLLTPGSNRHFHHFAQRIIDLSIIEILNSKSQIKYKKIEFKKKYGDDETDSRSLKITTVLEKYNMPFLIDFSFDFDEIKNSRLQISLPVFTKLIPKLIDLHLKNFSESNLNSKDENDTQSPLLFLKTIINYIFAWIEKDQNTCFSELSRLLKTTSDRIIKSGQAETLKIQTRFFDIFANCIEKLSEMMVQNRYLKECKLLELFFDKFDKSSSGNLVKLLSQLTSDSKIFSQLISLSNGSFSITFDILSTIFAKLFSEKNSFMMLFIIINHFVSFEEKIDDSIIGKFIFKLFKRIYKQNTNDKLENFLFFEVMNSFAKIIFGLQNYLSNVTDFFQNSEKQTLHFLRELPIEKSTRVAKIACHFFFEVISDKLFVKSLEKESFEQKNGDQAIEFLLFVILNQIGLKRKVKLGSKDSYQNIPLFNDVKILFLKRISEDFLLSSFISLSEKLVNNQFYLPVLNNLLDLIYIKFENTLFSKNFKLTFEAFLKVILEKIVFQMVFTDTDLRRFQTKFIKKSFAIINLLVRKNQNFAFKVLLKIDKLAQKCFKLVNNLEDIIVQFEIYKLLSRIAKSKDDNFLHIYNDLCQNFLSFSQMNIPKISEVETLVEAFSDTFLEFFMNLVLSFGNMVEPFIKDIFLVSTEIIKLNSTAHSKIIELLSLIAANVEFRIAFKHIDECVEYSVGNSSIQLFEIVSVFTKKTIHKIEFDTFAEKNNLIFSLIEKSIGQVFNFELLESQAVYFKQIWIDIFLEFALKCNEQQLQRFFAIFQKNSFKKMSIRQSLLHKEFLLNIFHHLVEKLGSFSMVLYGEMFEFCISLIQEINRSNVIEKTTKLKRSENEFFEMIYLKMHAHIMKAVEFLLNVDKIGFIDGFKFEQLVIPILESIPVARFGLEKDDIREYFAKSVYPALTSLLLLVNDEFKTKFVVLKLLKFCQEGDKMTKLLGVSAIKAIISAMNESFLVLVHDVVLKLSNLANDVDSEIADAVRGVIQLIEEMTGENIKEILQKEDLNFEY